MSQHVEITTASDVEDNIRILCSLQNRLIFEREELEKQVEAVNLDISGFQREIQDLEQELSELTTPILKAS